MAAPASEHPNVVRVRELFRAFSTSDPAEAHRIVLDAFHTDAVWHVLGTHDPLTGRYPSRTDLIERVFTPMYAATDYTWKVDPLSVVAAGDELVLVNMLESATIGGQTREGHVAVVLRLVDGKVVEGMRLPESSLDAHWSMAAAAR
jgi:ketosteroid isomerase-like protein